MNDVILYSGGLDSFLVYQYLRSKNREVKLLYFNIGARCCSSEIALFNSFQFTKIVPDQVDISHVMNMSNMETETAFIPNRNILAAIMANSVTGFSNIWIGGTLSDRVNDNNEKVFKSLSNLLTYMYNKKITISSPFFNKHKCQLIEEYVNSNGWGLYNNDTDTKLSLITATFSCYNPTVSNITTYFYNDNKMGWPTRECFECPACFRKSMSLFSGGIFVPMKRTQKSIDIVNNYYNEAVSNQNDVVMAPRYTATISYVNKLREYWG